MTAKGWKDYEIIGTSLGEKLERWGSIYLLRPDPQIIWRSESSLGNFKELNARYLRDSTGGGRWDYLKPTPDEWTVCYGSLKFAIKPMGFKHVGLFPEQAFNWEVMKKLIQGSGREISVLNLFAYTGGATAACAAAGAKVTHVDAAKGMVERAKSNCSLSGIGHDRVRYIVDDCKKFVQREIKRGKKYDAVIMDPPSYGRGPSGEIWKLEDNLFDFVTLVTEVLSDDPLFFLINSYTTGLQPSVIGNILSLTVGGKGGKHMGYELCLPTNENIVLPCGCSGIWHRGEKNILEGGVG